MKAGLATAVTEYAVRLRLTFPWATTNPCHCRVASGDGNEKACTPLRMHLIKPCTMHPYPMYYILHTHPAPTPYASMIWGLGKLG